MKVGAIDLAPPFALAPMAGMTDTAFRRLVKRHGGCGLVVSEMVSSEGLVRGIDRTLEYAEYTEEERPVSIQIFGGDPEKMAAAAQIVEGMGADVVDVNMGCPVPKIAKHNAGCSLMREPEHAAGVIGAMARAVRIPVTVKMRAGWDAHAINAPELAKRMEDAGAAAVAVHGRTAAQSYTGSSDWDLIARVAVGRRASRCSAAAIASSRGRWSIACAAARLGRARRPRRAAQPVDLRAGARHGGGPGAARGHRRGARPLPARVHRPAAERAGRRSRGLPARRAGSGAEADAAAGARPREMGDQQAARAELLVHQGARERLAPARPRSTAPRRIPQLRDIIETFFAAEPPSAAR